jgi:nucleoside-diphosphate-sugar epimerase
MSRILVTGATGFVGCHLCRRLLAAGHQVVALVRDEQRIPANLRGQIAAVRGDLTDDTSLRRAVRGCDAVCHLGALATAWDPDPLAYLRLNAGATGSLLEAAKDAGVSRFVHISTIAAVPGTGTRGHGTAPGSPTPYAVSKRISEALVRQYAAAGGNAVIVRPARVYGPGPCNDANGATRMMALYLTGRFRFVLRDGGARGNYVHVDDVARGIELALVRGRSGAAYPLGGQDITLRGLLETVGEIAGVHRRMLTVPVPLVMPWVHLGLVAGRVGLRPRLTPAWVRYFLEDRPLDLDPSRRELGYAPRSLRQGLSETLHWMMGSEGGERNGHRFYEHLAARPN